VVLVENFRIPFFYFKNVRLSDTQKCMIDLLKDNPKLNAQEIAQCQYLILKMKKIYLNIKEKAT
jgi:hypothetical protein